MLPNAPQTPKALLPLLTCPGTVIVPGNGELIQLIVSEMNRTLPSSKPMFTPPLWLLVAEETPQLPRFPLEQCGE